MFERLRQIVAKQLRIDTDNVTMETNIIEDLGADSLDLVEMLMSIEDKLGINIPDEDVAKFKTVGDFVQYLENIAK